MALKIKRARGELKIKRARGELKIKRARGEREVQAACLNGASRTGQGQSLWRCPRWALWAGMKRGAKQLHARNVHQVFGLYLDRPVQSVICWTPERCVRRDVIDLFAGAGAGSWPRWRSASTRLRAQS